MQKVTLGLTTLKALLLIGTTAFAADLPTKAPAIMAPIAAIPTWTGAYIGINGGGGWATQDQSIGGTNQAGSFAIATGVVPSSIATRGGGGMVGGTLGYNWQFANSFVLGAEADIDWVNIGGSGGQALSLAPVKIPVSLTTTGSQQLNWLGTVRARLGWLVTPTTLVFGTGGFAFGQVDTNTNITLSATTPFGLALVTNNNPTQTGWTVGAGVEHQLWNSNWTLKGEYRYVDLGSITNTLGGTIAPTTKFATPVTFATNQDLRYNIVLVGLNYKFW